MLRGKALLQNGMCPSRKSRDSGVDVTSIVLSVLFRSSVSGNGVRDGGPVLWVPFHCVVRTRDSSVSERTPTPSLAYTPRAQKPDWRDVGSISPCALPTAAPPRWRDVRGSSWCMNPLDRPRFIHRHSPVFSRAPPLCYLVRSGRNISDRYDWNMATFMGFRYADSELLCRGLFEHFCGRRKSSSSDFRQAFRNSQPQRTIPVTSAFDWLLGSSY